MSAEESRELQDRWTEQQLEEAEKAISFGGRESGIAFFGRHPNLGFRVATELQCELKAALARAEAAEAKGAQAETLLLYASAVFREQRDHWNSKECPSLAEGYQKQLDEIAAYFKRPFAQELQDRLAEKERAE